VRRNFGTYKDFMFICRFVKKERNGKMKNLAGRLSYKEEVRKDEKKNNGFFTKDKMALVLFRRRVYSLLGKNRST